MPVYTVGIAYTETVKRIKSVPITTNTAEEAETIARTAFRRYAEQQEDTLRVQGKDLGRVEDWERETPEHTFTVFAVGRTD